jgi:hypothetical protein
LYTPPPYALRVLPISLILLDFIACSLLGGGVIIYTDTVLRI